MTFTNVNLNDDSHAKVAVENVDANLRGKSISIRDWNPGLAKTRPSIHDSNFAFYSSELQKLDPTLYEPEIFFTYQRDIDIEVGGGFVDFISTISVDYAGLLNSLKAIVGNNANQLVRINASLDKKNIPVYTWEVGYDLAFVELEKLNKVQIQKSIKEIYETGIMFGWDAFVNSIVYEGANSDGTALGANGLFNSSKVQIIEVDNQVASGETQGWGYQGQADSKLIGFFNAIFAHYSKGSNMNLNVLPDHILLPTHMGEDLSNRAGATYMNSLRNYIVEHNLAVDENKLAEFKVTIESRPQLDKAGSYQAGRVVAYRKNKRFLHIEMPYPMQHFITLPNAERLSYTSAFVGQVSGVIMPYNTSSSELGIVSYWDFKYKPE